MHRWLIFAALSLATLYGSSRDTGWQTGVFRMEGAGQEGWRGSSVSAARGAPGNQSSDPLSDRIIFDMSSELGSYRASMTALLVDRSVSVEELLPWLSDMPQEVRFRIKGKKLYFMDAKNKQHQADIISSPHGSKK